MSETPENVRHELVGLILSGGRSSRMGGGDKGLLDLAGRPLLAHIIERFAPQVGALALNANSGSAGLLALGLPVISDATSDRPGPLAGVLAGLRWAERLEPRPKAIITVSCDAPFIPPDLVFRLGATASAGPGPIALARSRGSLHPVIGLWPLALSRDLEAALGDGVRKVLAWTDRHGAQPADFPDVVISGRSIDPFFNINTPADLAAAQALLGVAPSIGLDARARAPAHATRKSPTPRPTVVGVAGWKNSGKTTLVERLVAELTRRGLTVATVKHAHHDFDVDPGITDSARHRRAGARQVAVVSRRRWALITELRDESEPSLDAVLARLEPADVVLVEGYKRAPIAKIEVRRADQVTREPLAPADPHVIAIAADCAVSERHIPVYRLDDIAALADLIAARRSTATEP